MKSYNASEKKMCCVFHKSFQNAFVMNLAGFVLEDMKNGFSEKKCYCAQENGEEHS